MRRCLVAFAVVFSSIASAETLQEFDRRAEQELRALAPDAVDLWLRANRAREANRHEEAAQLYASVYARAPKFVHALRRQSHSELALGKTEEAKTHMREAMHADRSAENVGGMAYVLMNATGATPADYSEAAALAAEAEKMKPDDVYVAQLLSQAGALTGNVELLRRGVARLEKLEPASFQTHVLKHYVQAEDGQWDAAKASLVHARELGMPDEMFQRAMDGLRTAIPLHIRFGVPALKVIGGWFGAFALMLVAGVLLSRLAMRAAQQSPAVLAENSTGLGSRVRRIYSTVLTLSCVFYYVSIPLVLLTVLAAGAGVIYGFFALGRIPVKLLIVVVLVVAVSAWSIVKSLFIRPADVEPGTKLDLAAHPKLRGVLDEVAAQIGTRAVDNVYLTPGTDVAVMERGKGAHRERCLILGIAALEGFRMRPFRAVLAHEYGHFSNRDTAGGAFALSVRRSLGATAIGLAEGGAAAWYNPAWLFVNGFHRVFLRISEGASRLQEILADRWAVFAYGAPAFEEGLRHVIERSVRFDAHIDVTLREVVDRQASLANLYTYRPTATDEHLAEKVEEAINEPGSAYDSHPPAAQRFALAHALPQHEAIAAADDDDSAAWSLFDDPEELQRFMTVQVRANVAAHYGVHISGE